jgi:hypothetical protein
LPECCPIPTPRKPLKASPILDIYLTKIPLAG